MSHFLRRLSISGRNALIRAIAIASAGSGFLYANGNTDLNSILGASVTVRIPASLRESLSLPCQLEHELFLGPSPFAIDHGLSGMFPLYSRSVIPVSTPDKKNEAFGIVDAGEAVRTVDKGSKPCGCGCLGKDSIANAAAKVAPSVVNISAAQGFYGISAGKSIGTGTIIDKDGTILTCAHVVVDLEGMISTSKGKVDVTLQDGRTFEGVVLNVDLHSDIAIVKINSQTPLPAAQLGSSSRLRPGDWVIAMGCPLSLQNTVTAGIVSCVDRKSSDLGLVGMRREYLQTDCAINVGNSGGPLVNIDGEVVGINIMKVVAADGVGFSVPIDSVRKIIEQFKKNGRVVRPWLGVKMMDLNEMTLAQIKKRDASFPNIKKGVVVPMVTPGSPADRAGFRPRDIVVEFDGKPVENSDEIVEIMGDRVGVPMKVVVIRVPDEIKTLTVIPEEANLDL